MTTTTPLVAYHGAHRRGPAGAGDGAMRPRVYLAGRYSRRLELLGYARELAAMGCDLSCRWLLGAHETPAALADEHGDQGFSADERGRFAREDLRDLSRADLVIAFTEAPRSGPSRGGRHVELGVAIGLGKQTLIVGPRENVFCCLDDLPVAADWTEARVRVGEWAAEWVADAAANRIAP